MATVSSKQGVFIYCLKKLVYQGLFLSNGSGLEALGLGPFDSPTLGMTIYWNIQFSSILHGLWWWFGPPILVLAMIFVGLFLMTAGLDEWSNPRLRKRV